MKQSKRLLCVLLAMVMMLSTLTVAASAYKTSYARPAGYDTVNQPYFNNDQAASALLNYIDDDVLADLNISFKLDIAGIDINIYSLDSLYDSIKDLLESTAYKLGSILNLGDIEKMSWGIPKNSSIRRRSTTLSDFEFFTYFLQFVQSNYNYLYKWADNSFSLGIIKNFWNPKEKIPMLNDLHGYINEMVYKALIDSEGTGFDAATSNLDAMIQDFINNRCVKFICDKLAKPDGSNAVADFLGLEKNEDGTLKNNMGLLQLCPSLSASDISITQTSTYDLITNLLNALINDVVLPYAGGLILNALKIQPDDTTADTAYIDIAIGLFVKPESVGLEEDAEQSAVVAAFLEQHGVENPTAPKPIDKVNTTLSYILSDGIKQYIYFQDDENGGEYLTLSPTFVSELSNYIKMILPILGTLWAQAPTLSSAQAAALEDMNDEQTFAFAAQFFLDTLVEGVRFPKNCDTIKELATYTLVNVAAELIPDVDFEAKIESGEIDPNSDQCLDVAAAVIRYYLVGETGIVIENKTPTFEELLNDCFDYYLNKYSKLFNVYPTDSDYQTYKNNVWYKIYMSANQWIPFTNIVYGVEDNWQGIQEIIMDKLVNGVLDFDIQKILSLVGKRPDSDLQKPLAKVIVNLAGRVINGVFQLPTEKSTSKTDNAAQKDLIIPYAYSTLDQVITNINSSPSEINGCGLKNTVNRLLYYITNITGDNSLCSTSLDIIAYLLGVIKLKDFDYIKVDFEDNMPAGTTYSIAQLKTLYNQLKLTDNTGLKYYDEGYRFFRMVDFAPWAYLDFKRCLRSAETIIEEYDAAKADPDTFTFPTRAEITYAYYTLNSLHQVIIGTAVPANNYQLNKIYNEANSNSYTNTNEDGSQKYTTRSWNALQQALAFATKVMNEYAQYEADGILSDYRQSKVNAARQSLMDAIDGLKENVGDANYSDLQNAINRFKSLENPYSFSNSSIKEAVEAYMKAINLDTDYDLDDQKIVDAAYTQLTKAIDELQSKPYIELYDTQAQYIDNEFNFMYGFNQDFYNSQDAEDWGDDFATYFLVNYGSSGDGDVSLVPTAHGNGTGSKLQVVAPDGDSYKIVREYTMVMFGDVNGDSKIDAQDAVIMRAYATFLLDPELCGRYVSYAADIDYDGNIGANDAKIAEKSGINKATVNQLPEEYTSKTTHFTDVIDQFS